MMTRIHISMPQKLIDEFNLYVTRNYGGNISEAIRNLIIKELNNEINDDKYLGLKKDLSNIKSSIGYLKKLNEFVFKANNEFQYEKFVKYNSNNSINE